MPAVDHEVPPHPDGDDDAAWLAWANALGVTRALGLHCDALQDGVATFTLAEPPMRNSRGWAHGGLMLAVADQCFGAVVMRSAPGQVRATTVTLNAQFLRPAVPPVTIESRVTKLGRTLVFAELQAVDGDRRPCMTAQATLTVTRRDEQ